MFPKSVQILLKCFDVLGFWTEYCKERMWVHITYIACCFHIVLVSISTFFVMYLTINPGDFPEWFYINELVKHYSASVAYWTILIESYMQRTKQQRFWKIYSKINDYSRVDELPIRSYWLKFFKHFLENGLIEIILTGYFFRKNIIFIGFVTMHIILLELYQCRLFYYLFHLEIIKVQIKHLARDVRNLWKVNQNNYACFKKSLNTDNFDLDEIREIRTRFHLIFEAFQNIDAVFAWSNLFTILYAFHNAFAAFNWSFQTFDELSWIGTGLIFADFSI